jgi:PPOX class probable F420-dependent enzyme
MNRTNAFEHLRRTKTILLTSYRRDGTPVATPVSIAFEGDRAFFRTWDTAWKARRLRRNPVVEIAPATLRGEPTGRTLRARARLLAGDEAVPARDALARRHPFLHGLLVPLTHRLKGHRTVHYELLPLE